MARIRTIKPEFFCNESLSALAPATHLLAAALLCYADDEGYFLAHPGLIRANCLPLREDSVSVQGMMDELSNLGYVEIVKTAEGKLLGRVVKFLEHQVINRPSPSKIKKLWPFTETSVSIPVVISEDSVTERNREQGKEGKGTGGSAAHSTPPIEIPKPSAPKPTPNAAPSAVDDTSDPETCARGMFECLAIVAPPKTVKLAAEAIRMQATALCTTACKAMLLIRRRAELAMQAGESVNAFWFEDSKWKAAPSPVAIGVYQGDDSASDEPAETAPEGVDTELGARIWTGINKALKSEIPAQSYDTWIKPIKPLGALNGELYLQIPSPDFAHVGDRYDIAKFLPAGVEGIHLLSATGVAA